ncbi:hypothetical protein C8R44DRAFT_886089 [Mycena epipterygia]|nr:hypothetical protein C8R44DRAFT_886089 [Mycena epipterygia]
MTPSPSPTTETHAQYFIRCKRIKPLITKRAVSTASSSAQPASVEGEACEDDDEFYAARAHAFITLAPPLPPSLPAASSTRTAHRESSVVPRILALVRPPPPVSTHSRSDSTTSTSSYSCCGSPSPGYSLAHRLRLFHFLIHFRSQSAAHADPQLLAAYVFFPLPPAARVPLPKRKAPPPSRPPPRTPLPTDASSDFAAGNSRSASLAPPTQVEPHALHDPNPTPLGPPPPRPRALAALLADVVYDDSYGVNEANGYDDVPLSPFVACAPSSSPSPVDEKEEVVVSPYTGSRVRVRRS